MLEELEFYTFEFVNQREDQESADYGHSKLAQIIPGRLQTLRLGLNAHGASLIMKKVNHLFSFVLDSCPLLKTFDLSGCIDDGYYTLNLDFRNHAHLKCVEIDLEQCNAYTFRHVLGVIWKNSFEPFGAEEWDRKLREEKEAGEEHHHTINLAWDVSNRDIQFNLADVS